MAATLDTDGALITAKDALEQVRFILDAVLDDADFQAIGFPPRLYYLVRAADSIAANELLDQEAKAALNAGGEQ